MTNIENFLSDFWLGFPRLMFHQFFLKSDIQPYKEKKKIELKCWLITWTNKTAIVVI